MFNNNTTYEEYVVQKNDSLYSIAKKFKTTIAEITDVNMLTSTTIYPNQILLVPVYESKQDGTYVTVVGDTFELISKKSGVCMEDLGEYNDFSKIPLKEGTVIYLENNERSYIVSTDDSVSNIISKTGRSAEELLSLNIKPNMRLKV